MRYCELLTEAKEIFDFRHSGSSELPFFGATRKSEYIPPEKGFHWSYRDGILQVHSTNNSFYDYIVSFDLERDWKNNKDKVRKQIPRHISNSFNDLGGFVDLEQGIIKISKEFLEGLSTRQRAIADRKAFVKALKELKKFGVKDDFKIRGVPADIPKTVGKALQLTDPRDDLYGNKPLIMYHGTSEKRWNEIQRIGLQPGHTGEAYKDLVKNYSENNVYLTASRKTAEFYAKRQEGKDGSQPVMLKVQVPDPSKIRADDRYAKDPTGEKTPDYMGSRTKAIKAGLSEMGEVAYKGRIPPKFIQKI